MGEYPGFQAQDGNPGTADENMDSAANESNDPVVESIGEVHEDPTSLQEEADKVRSQDEDEEEDGNGESDENEDNDENEDEDDSSVEDKQDDEAKADGQENSFLPSKPSASLADMQHLFRKAQRLGKGKKKKKGKRKKGKK